MSAPLNIPVLFAFEEDILQRSWLDWLVAHISFLKPLHRYEGTMLLEPARITLLGKDKKTSAEIQETILKHQVTQLYHGFDKVFTMGETRSLGLGGLPLRMTYQKEGMEKNLYIISNYQLGSWNNLPCFELLKQWSSS